MSVSASREQSTEPELLVTFEQVAKAYAGGTVALREASFSLRRGEFVSLVGPSGCGKSTVLRLVAGLSQATAGRVTLGGLPPALARRQRQDLAYVFQDATLLPWRNVERNVELPLQLSGIDHRQRRERARQALTMVGLGDVGGAYPRQLSGGMRMRVSIARALVMQPSLLLMDEPFGALDELAREKLNLELLRIVSLAGWTVLFVTHNVFEAVFLSSRILVMSPRPGRILADIPVDLPFPREKSMRTGVAFNAMAGRVLQALTEDS
jgi:NitT/TauT family transport system ATP-binding protein